VVDTGAFRYYVTASAGFILDPSTISLSTVQFVYTAA
jgi:hypothetical protein